MTPLDEARRLAPVFAGRADKHDADGSFPVDDFADLRSSGLLGLMVPTRLGGSGATFADYAEVALALAAGSPSTALVYNMHASGTGALAQTDGRGVDKVVHERAIRHVQEGDARVADHLRCGSLLALARRGELERIDVGILAALVAARAADEPAHGALIDPRRSRGRRPEVGVIGVRGDDHESRRTPVVRDRGGIRFRRCLLRHAAARAARSSPSAWRTSAAWPSALTFGQARAMRPSGSIR